MKLLRTNHHHHRLTRSNGQDHRFVRTVIPTSVLSGNLFRTADGKVFRFADGKVMRLQ